MLPMPVQTTTEAVAFILKSINNKIDASDIRLAPGSQMRHDRWQAMVSQESVHFLPAHFVLKGLGPENEDLNVKLFVEGRKSPHTDKTEQLKTTPKVSQLLSHNAPPPPPLWLHPLQRQLLSKHRQYCSSIN